MDKCRVTYEEFAVDLANAYPDLDLHELSLDDIKTMMGHALTDDPSKYGLSSVDDSPPAKRRRQSKSKASEDVHVEASSSRNENTEGNVQLNVSVQEQSDNSCHQELEGLSQISGVTNFGDISKLPIATQQALFASAALLSFSRGQNVLPNPRETPTHDDSGSSKKGKTMRNSSHSHPQRKTSKTVSSESNHDSVDEVIASVIRGDISYGNEQSASGTETHESNLNAPLVRRESSVAESLRRETNRIEHSAVLHKQNSEPLPQDLSSMESACNSSVDTNSQHKKLRQLLEVGYQELISRWGDAEKSDTTDSKQASAMSTLTNSELQPRPISIAHANQEHMKTMNPGHPGTDGLFKVPDEKHLPPRSVELDTPPPGRTSLSVNYGYAPNIAVRTDTTLPLTPPQASPPEINMAKMTSASLSNLMSKHLLSTTQSLKAGTLMGGAVPAFSMLPDGGNTIGVSGPEFLSPGSLDLARAAIYAMSSKPTTHISYLPLSSASQTRVVGQKIDTNGLMAPPPPSSLGHTPASQNLMNGVLSVGQAASPGVPTKTTPKKSKKRRRKSESNDSLGSFGSPDGSPRLIKKIGRVIQTVENEQDLNCKVKAMLNNIMGKFQQRQLETGTSPVGAAAPVPSVSATVQQPPLDEPATEESIRQVAQQIGAMAATQTPPPPMNPTGNKTPSKKKKSKRKSPARESPGLQHQSQVSSPLCAAMTPISVHLPDANAALGLPSKTEDVFVSPAAFTQTLTALSQAQNLFQNLPNLGFSLPMVKNTSDIVQPQSIPTTLLPANQPMPTSEALAAAKKVLQDYYGITLSDSTTKAADLNTHSLKSEFGGLTSMTGLSPTTISRALGLASPGQALLPQLVSALDKSGTITYATESPAQINYVMSLQTPQSADSDSVSFDLKSPKIKKQKKREKLSETDIANIGQLLKKANSQYFTEFFNQLQAFAYGRNPEWMKQYPNIASYMGLTSDSKEKAKLILEYMREQTGLAEGQDMTVNAKLNFESQAFDASTSEIDAATVMNQKAVPSLQSVVKSEDPHKYAQMNGVEIGLIPDSNFIDSFQQFIHSNKSPSVVTSLPNTSTVTTSVKAAKKPSRQLSSTSTQSRIYVASPASISLQHSQSSSSAKPLDSQTILSLNATGSSNILPQLDMILKALELDISKFPTLAASLTPTATAAVASGVAKVTEADVKGEQQFALDSSHSSSEFMQGTPLASKLKRNYTDPIEDVPKCDCLKGACHDEGREGPFYTHLGAASDLVSIRQLLQDRLQLSGEALRIEQVLHTSKAGKSAEGCPIPRWILRRSGPEEKALVLVRRREGHRCASALLVIALVLWEAISPPQADSLYDYLNTVLPTAGGGAKRQKSLADKRACACSTAAASEHAGVALHFGCSYSTHARTCRHAKNPGTPRKFKLDNSTEQEPVLEEKLQSLATQLAPVCRSAAPLAYQHMVQFEEEGGDCRLGQGQGRPFSGVTALMDSSSHCQKQRMHSNNGCSMIVTLKSRDAPDSQDSDGAHGGDGSTGEALHIFPMCVLDTCDDSGSMHAQRDKLRAGAIQYLSKRPLSPPPRRPRMNANGRSAKGTKRGPSCSWQHDAAGSKFRRLSSARPKARLVPQGVLSKLNLKTISRRVQAFRTSTGSSSRCHFANRKRTNNAFGNRVLQNRAKPELRHQRLATQLLRDASENRNTAIKVASPINFTKQGKVRKRGAKTKRWQEMMSDPSFVNNLITVGHQMYGPSETESMVGRLKSVAKQETLLNNQQQHEQTQLSTVSNSIRLSAKSSPKASKAGVSSSPSVSVHTTPSSTKLSTKLCLQANFFQTNAATWEEWYRESAIETGNSSVYARNHMSAKRSLTGNQLHSKRSVDSNAGGPGSKPEEVAGWGMYSMPPNRSVFDIASPRKSISTELLRSVNRHATQSSSPPMLSSTGSSGAASSGENSSRVESCEKRTHVNSVNKNNSSASSKKATLSDTDDLQKLNMHNLVQPDFDMGGVAVALTHGSVLFEVSKREMHASATHVVNPKNKYTSCISLIFHQQKGLNLPRHGREEHLQFEEMRRIKESGEEVKTEEISELEQSVTIIKEEDETTMDTLQVPVYSYLWDTEVVRGETSSTNTVSYSWLRPQTAVYGPYQRWLWPSNHINPSSS